MIAGNRSQDASAERTPLPEELERKLQLCEGIVDRMRLLQEQVDWELKNGHPEEPGKARGYEAAPAIRLAVGSVLRWITHAIGSRRP